MTTENQNQQDNCSEISDQEISIKLKAYRKHLSELEEKHKPKSLFENLAEDPFYLEELDRDNKENFYLNGMHFLEQADMKLLVQFLGKPEISQQLKEAGLADTVKALTRFNTAAHDNLKAREMVKAWREIVARQDVLIGSRRS